MLGHRIAERYPRTPAGWTVVARRAVGPFTTRVEYRTASGETKIWSSRFHRKHASLLSRAERGRERTWWAPRRAGWWIGVLFAIGSSCFLVGPFPGFLSLVGSRADGVVFFAGSVFFTAAALLQYLEAANADEAADGVRRRRMRLFTFEPHRIDWWATLIQLAGTIFFNLSTFHALQQSFDTESVNRLVWRPDVFGSICFLVASYLAYVEIAGGLWRRVRGSVGWRIAALNMVGSVAFGVSAVASYTLPETGDVLALGAANFTTAFGALCFLLGAVLLLPEAAEPQPAD